MLEIWRIFLDTGGCKQFITVWLFQCGKEIALTQGSIFHNDISNSFGIDSINYF